MKKFIFIIPIFIMTFLFAEDFVIKKNKKTQSPNKLKEEIANELGKIIKFSSQNHKFLAKIQERSLEQTYSLLEGNFSIDNKDELKKYLEKTKKIKLQLEEQNNFLKENYKTITP